MDFNFSMINILWITLIATLAFFISMIIDGIVKNRLSEFILKISMLMFLIVYAVFMYNFNSFH